MGAINHQGLNAFDGVAMYLLVGVQRSAACVHSNYYKFYSYKLLRIGLNKPFLQ